MSEQVHFKEGTQSDYENITPSEDTFYKVTQSSGYDVYLGDVKLNNQADIDAIYKILEEMEDEIKKLDPSPVELKPLADCTPEEIQKIAQSGQAMDIWSIGDRYPVVLNGDVSTHTFDNETWYMTIIGFDHNAELETGGKPSVTFQFGEAEDGTRICFRDPNYDGGTSTSATGFRMNTSNTNVGGWESSWMRNTVLLQFFEALPVDLQNIIGTVTKYTDNVGNESGSVESNVTATEDKIFLLSMYEVGLSPSYVNSYEANYQQTYSNYYSNNSSRIRYKQFDTSTATNWWSRSVSASSSTYFYYITSSGFYTTNTAHYSYGLAPALCVF